MIRDTSGQDKVLAAPPGRRSRRIAAGSLGALALLAAVVWMTAAWRSSTHSVSMQRLRIAAVTRGTLVRDAAVNGRVVAAVSPTLYSTAPGNVTLRVQAGDKVKQGDVVAEIASPDLADQLKRERSSLEQLQAEVARQQILARKQKLLAKREADTAEIDRVAALRTYERIEKAGLAGVVPKNDFEKAQDNLRSAEIRSRHAAQAALLENDDVDLELKTKLSQLQRQRLAVDYAQRRVDELKLKAPVDGVVGSVAIADRTVVAANVPVMTLVDLSRLEVELEIPETYVGDLGVGMTVEIVAGDVRATGKLASLSPEVVKNMVSARVRFDGAQPAGLRQSQRVSARLLIDEKKDAVMVARGPFLEQDGGRFLYVVENGSAVRRPVKLGATSVSAVEIVSGAQPGDKVVVAGTDAFEHAARVPLVD